MNPHMDLKPHFSRSRLFVPYPRQFHRARSKKKVKFRYSNNQLKAKHQRCERSEPQVPAVSRTDPSGGTSQHPIVSHRQEDDTPHTWPIGPVQPQPIMGNQGWPKTHPRNVQVHMVNPICVSIYIYIYTYNPFFLLLNPPLPPLTLKPSGGFY